MRDWFASSKSRLRSLRRLSWRQRLALLEAVLWLGLARGMVLVLPFKWIAPSLGPLNEDGSHHCDEAQQVIVQRLGRAIRTASRFTPWKSNCLAQAIAGKIMLRRRGIPSTLYLGLKKDADLLEAHAWLHTGCTMVTGGDREQEFKIISFFGAEPK